MFAIKGYRLVTQTSHLRYSRPRLADFFASGVLRLEHKLGPLLWQLPSELTLLLNEIERFVALLPHDFEAAASLASESGESTDAPTANRVIRHAIEIRNATFIDAGFVELMRTHNIAIVLTNSPEHPQLHELTGDFVYARLRSGPDHYPDGYDDATLDGWATEIDGWLAGPPGRDVFVYFNNPAGELPHTPINALRLIERLRGATTEHASRDQLF